MPPKVMAPVVVNVSVVAPSMVLVAPLKAMLPAVRIGALVIATGPVMEMAPDVVRLALILMIVALDTVRDVNVVVPTAALNVTAPVPAVIWSELFPSMVLEKEMA